MGKKGQIIEMKLFFSFGISDEFSIKCPKQRSIEK